MSFGAEQRQKCVADPPWFSQRRLKASYGCVAFNLGWELPAPGSTPAAVLVVNAIALLHDHGGQTAQRQIPDDIVFIDAVPKTIVDKFYERALREEYHGYYLAGF